MGPYHVCTKQHKATVCSTEAMLQGWRNITQLKLPRQRMDACSTRLMSSSQHNLHNLCLAHQNMSCFTTFTPTPAYCCCCSSLSWWRCHALLAEIADVVSSRHGGQSNSSTGSHASSQCSIAPNDNSRRASASSHRTKSNSSCSVACHNDCVAPTLARAIAENAQQACISTPGAGSQGQDEDECQSSSSSDFLSWCRSLLQGTERDVLLMAVLRLRRFVSRVWHGMWHGTSWKTKTNACYLSGTTWLCHDSNIVCAAQRPSVLQPCRRGPRTRARALDDLAKVVRGCKTQ